MDEFVCVLIAGVALVARFAIYVVVDIVFETVIRGAITGLLWLVWPGGRKSEVDNRESDEARRHGP